MAKTGFVPLAALKKGPPDPAEALADIRRIYFNTSRVTIEHDFAHAIELLKSLPTDEEREKATVYMHGLSEMQRQWQKPAKRPGARPPGRKRPGPT